MKIPGTWDTLLLLAASYRIWRVLAFDTVFDAPRRWLLVRTPEKFEKFLTCPWCAGFWICGVWYLAWQQWPHLVLVLSVWWAMSLAIGLIARNWDP